MKRKTREDWLRAGLAALVQNGPAAATIDKLAERLGVTKGSFYHHFNNRRDFKEKLLAFWEEIDTHFIVESSGASGRSSNGVDGLLRILGSRSAKTANPEMAIRAWALQDKSVRAYVERVDAYRLSILQDMFRSMAGDEERAFLMTHLLYAMLIGCYSIMPPVEKENLARLYREFKRLYDMS